MVLCKTSIKFESGFKEVGVCTQHRFTSQWYFSKIFWIISSRTQNSSLINFKDQIFITVSGNSQCPLYYSLEKPNFHCITCPVNKSVSSWVGWTKPALFFPDEELTWTLLLPKSWNAGNEFHLRGQERGARAVPFSIRAAVCKMSICS